MTDPSTTRTPPPEGSVLDRQTLNRTLLARQRLLTRERGDAAETIEHLVGLQAQVPADPHISLRARLQDFETAELDRLLLERRLVRMNLQRGTIHLVSAGDAVRLRPLFADMAQRLFASMQSRRRLEGLDLAEVAAAGAALLEAAPLTMAELGARLTERWPERDPDALAYCVRYLVPLVHVTPRGLWRRSAAARLTTLGAWLGGETPVSPGSTGSAASAGSAEVDAPAGSGGSADVATRPDALVLRYLRAFGPASVADIRTWSWLTGLREVIDRLRPQLCSYRDQSGRELLDVQGGEFASPETPAPARLLGEYDNVFLAHADRTRITGDERWGAAYAHRASFFVDGYLAGSWRFRGSRIEATLEISPVRPLASSEKEALAAEAEELLALMSPEARARRLIFEDA